MVGSSEGSARAGVDNVKPKLFADGEQSVFPEDAIGVDRESDRSHAVLGKHDYARAAGFEMLDQVAADLVNCAQIGFGRGSVLLQRVVQVRQEIGRAHV